jgi:hypothetical protein
VTFLPAPPPPRPALRCPGAPCLRLHPLPPPPYPPLAPQPPQARQRQCLPPLPPPWPRTQQSAPCGSGEARQQSPFPLLLPRPHPPTHPAPVIPWPCLAQVVYAPTPPTHPRPVTPWPCLVQVVYAPMPPTHPRPVTPWPCLAQVVYAQLMAEDRSRLDACLSPSKDVQLLSRCARLAGSTCLLIQWCTVAGPVCCPVRAHSRYRLSPGAWLSGALQVAATDADK